MRFQFLSLFLILLSPTIKNVFSCRAFSSIPASPDRCEAGSLTEDHRLEVQTPAKASNASGSLSSWRGTDEKAEAGELSWEVG